jgi:uncharacterized repeat protein (TIGR01451 family)
MFAATALLFTALVVVAAVVSPSLKVDLAGSIMRDGRAISLDNVGRVNPGEAITWSFNVSNQGNAPANAVKVVGDVDDATAYVPGSAAGDGVTSVKYSLEHPHANQTFSERPMVQVNEGGVVRERPASPDKYKAIQFTFQSVGAGENKKATYQTRVR